MLGPSDLVRDPNGYLGYRNMCGDGSTLSFEDCWDSWHWVGPHSNSDLSKWWLLLYSELWKLWWRWHHVWSFLKSSAHNARIQQLSHGLSALHDPKSRSSVKLEFTPPYITRLWLFPTKRDVIILMTPNWIGCFDDEGNCVCDKRPIHLTIQ